MNLLKKLIFLWGIGISILPTFAQSPKQLYYVLAKEKNAGKNFQLPYISQNIDIPLFSCYLNPDSLAILSQNYWIYPVESQPKEEISVPGHSLAVDRFNALHAHFPEWNGKDVRVSLKENAFDSTDIDLKGRVFATTNAAKEISLHATLMASIIAGAGNSEPDAKGGAWAANISSSDFQNLLPDADSLFLATNINVQNHSYGTVIADSYGAEAYSYDAQMQRIPNLLHVFSAGNEGSNSSNSGVYANIQGYANLTGNFKMAKNVLTVGSINKNYQVEAYSSKGPAVWGRIKPEIVAYSSNGTSGSAASVSAAALVLQGAYQSKYGLFPPTSLLKALIINSADEVGSPHIDYATGYGCLNVLQAMNLLTQEQFFIDTLFSTQAQSYPLQVPSNVSNLKISLVWTDNAEPEGKLFQNLNMRLVAENGTIYMPWCLNPHRDSLTNPAFRGIDSVNTAELIGIDFPTEGTYTLEIQATKVQYLPQIFSVVWDMQKKDSLLWTYPSVGEIAYKKQPITLRWSETSLTEKGLLSYQWQGDTVWLAIDSVFLKDKNYAWQMPDRTGIIQFCWKSANQSSFSPKLHIQSPIEVSVAFNCTDSMAIFWNKTPEILDYQVFYLGTNYLEKERITQDTFLVFPKNASLATRWSVAPLFSDGSLGKNSPAPDYRSQGLDCYFRNFFAENDENHHIKLSASIGSLYQVEKMIFEKWDGNGFRTIATFNPHLTFEMTDTLIKEGLNRYRAKLFFQDATYFQEEETFVYSTVKQAFLFFPNPSVNKQITILCQNPPDENTYLQLADIQGKVVFTASITDIFQTLEVPQLNTGMYSFQLYSAKKLYKSGILMIY